MTPGLPPANAGARGRAGWRLASLPLLAMLVLLAASLPRFFSIQRAAAFETFPRDPYETYVLHLAGEPGGIAPGAPHVYRLFSFAAAVPIYKSVPVLYGFSRLENVDPRRLRATQAMALLSWLALLGLCATTYFAARRGFGASPAVASGAALAAWVLAEGTNLLALDTLALCLIALLSLALPKPRVFIPLILLSTGFNEKIPLIFAALLLARAVVDRARAFSLKPQLLAACAAVALYAAARLAFPMGGGENQTDPSTWAGSIAGMVALTFSAKGLVLNLLPGLLVFGLWILARGPVPVPAHPSHAIFHPADLAALALVAALAFAARVEYGAGRVLLYCFPLYLPAACAALGRLGVPPQGEPSP